MLTAATEQNVRLNVARLTTAEPILAGRMGSGAVRAVGGVYDLASRRVKLPLEADAGVSIRMAPPPADAAGFDQLGLHVAGSGRVKELLKG